MRACFLPNCENVSQHNMEHSHCGIDLSCMCNRCVDNLIYLRFSFCRYAIISEQSVEGEIEVCGGHGRERSIYTSIGSSITIKPINGLIKGQTPHYIFKYTGKEPPTRRGRTQTWGWWRTLAPIDSGIKLRSFLTFSSLVTACRWCSLCKY